MPTSKRTRTPTFLSARWSSHGEISKRIKIDQPIERPIRLQKRDVVRWHQVRQSPWWMILHRRGTYRPKIGEDQLEARAVSKAEVRGTLPERIIFRFLVEKLHLTDQIEFDFQCVTGDTKVLTANLRWIPVSEIKAGDELLSFSEHSVGAHTRKWERGVVLHNEPDEAEVYRVELSDGTVIHATPEHPWLAHYSPQKHYWGKGCGLSWVQTKDLRIGGWLPKYLDTWEENTSRTAGYIAGFFDGEGSVVHSKSATGGNVMSLTASQNKGPLMDMFIQCVTEAGFDFSVYDYCDKYKRSYDDGKRRVVNCRIAGGRAEGLRFLGSIRPQKLERMQIDKLGKLTKHSQVQIVSITPAGKKTIYRLGVDKKTYVAEGFGMHNSSLQGGRLQLGGIVVDFTFPMWGFAIQVDGPTHLDFRRMAKDTEQEMALEAMGYRVFRIAEDVVYDEYQLEEWMRRTFNLALGLGGTGYSSQDVNSLPTSTPQFDLDSVFSLIWELNVRVDNLYRELMI